MFATVVLISAVKVCSNKSNNSLGDFPNATFPSPDMRNCAVPFLSTTSVLLAAGDGLQKGVYGTTDCQNFTVATNCLPAAPEGVHVLTNTGPLIPGRRRVPAGYIYSPLPAFRLA